MQLKEAGFQAEAGACAVANLRLRLRLGRKGAAPEEDTQWDPKLAQMPDPE